MPNQLYFSIPQGDDSSFVVKLWFFRFTGAPNAFSIVAQSSAIRNDTIARAEEP